MSLDNYLLLVITFVSLVDLAFEIYDHRKPLKKLFKTKKRKRKPKFKVIDGLMEDRA